MRKLIATDMDGTLINTSKVHYYSYKEALNEYGYDLTYEHYMNVWFGGFYQEFMKDTVKSDEEIKLIYELKTSFISKNIDKAVLNKKLVDFIKCSKPEYYAVLVTTSSKKSVNLFFDYFDLHQYFDYVITSESVKNQKPFPDGYLLAMEKCGVTPENTIIFEDSSIGKKAALATGADVYMVYGYR